MYQSQDYKMEIQPGKKSPADLRSDQNSKDRKPSRGRLKPENVDDNEQKFAKEDEAAALKKEILEKQNKNQMDFDKVFHYAFTLFV